MSDSMINGNAHGNVAHRPEEQVAALRGEH
jgi:hypothetical protein